MAAVANLEFRIGEHWNIDATMHDSCGAILPIVGSSIKWRLALNNVVITELSIGDGIRIVGDGSGGECVISLTPGDQLTLGINPGFYTHECQVILADGEVTDQFAGTIEALKSLFPA